MPIEPNPRSRAQVRAASRAFRALPPDLKNEIRKAQRSEIGPIWKGEMSEAVAGADARQGMQARVFGAGARVKAGLPATLIAGGSSRAMRGGASPSDLARPFEFGTGRREKYTRYTRRSRSGGSHTVTRRTSRQLPLVRRVGYVVYPAASQTIPRLIGTWVRSITDRIYQAVEGK